MRRPGRWTLLWLSWLGFVLLDFVAAVKERSGGVLTLSRHIWAWFPWGWRRSVLAAFLGALGAHLVFEAPAWWLVTAVPVVGIIVYAVGWEGSVTRADWDAEWEACFKRLRSKGADLLEAQRLARDITTVRYGARPAGLPLTWRLALGFLSQKAGGHQMLQRILTSIGFGLSVGLPLYGAATLVDSPGGAAVLGAEWAAIVYTSAVAAYGNYKTNTTILAPNRTEWTPEQRAIETAKMDAGVMLADAKVVAADKVADAKAVADAKVVAEK